MDGWLHARLILIATPDQIEQKSAKAPDAIGALILPGADRQRVGRTNVPDLPSGRSSSGRIAVVCKSMLFAAATIDRFGSALHPRCRDAAPVPEAPQPGLIAPSLAPSCKPQCLHRARRLRSNPPARGGRYRTVTPVLGSNGHGRSRHSRVTRPRSPRTSDFAEDRSFTASPCNDSPITEHGRGLSARHLP
jgi:hypothetical protein